MGSVSQPVQGTSRQEGLTEAALPSLAEGSSREPELKPAAVSGLTSEIQPAAGSPHHQQPAHQPADPAADYQVQLLRMQHQLLLSINGCCGSELLLIANVMLQCWSVSVAPVAYIHGCLKTGVQTPP